MAETEKKTIESPLVALACRSSQSLKIQFGALRTSQSPPRPASAGCHEMREFENFGENENALVCSSTSQLERNSFGKNCSWLAINLMFSSFSASLSDWWHPLLDFQFYTNYVLQFNPDFLKIGHLVLSSHHDHDLKKQRLICQLNKCNAMYFLHLLGASEDAPIVVNVCKNVYAG